LYFIAVCLIPCEMYDSLRADFIYFVYLQIFNNAVSKSVKVFEDKFLSGISESKKELAREWR
jgi:hypothetical protein